MRWIKLCVTDNMHVVSYNVTNKIKCIICLMKSVLKMIFSFHFLYKYLMYNHNFATYLFILMLYYCLIYSTL